jgi:hypothetical protein
MAIGGVVINFTARTKDAVKNVGKLNRELGGTDKETKGLTGRLSKFSKVGLLGMASAAGAAAAGLANAVELAAQERTEVAKLEGVLRNVTDATEDQIAAVDQWIGKMELGTEVADTQLRDSLGRLASATGDVTEAQELMALAVDTSVARGESLDSVVRALEKAVGGNTETLKRQMPWLDKNNDGTVTLKEAVEGLEEAYGGAAEAAAESNGPMAEIGIMWERMQETLGTALLPYMDQFTQYIGSEKGQQDLLTFAANVGKVVDVFADLAGMISDVADAYNSLPPWMTKFSSINAAGEIGRAVKRSRDYKAALNVPRTGRDGGTMSAGRVTNITINNPKPEASALTTARAIRMARAAGGY